MNSPCAHGQRAGEGLSNAGDNDCLGATGAASHATDDTEGHDQAAATSRCKSPIR